MLVAQATPSIMNRLKVVSTACLLASMMMGWL